MQLKLELPPKAEDKSVCDKCHTQNTVTNWTAHRHSNVVTLIYKCKCGRVRLDWVTSDDKH